MYKVTVIIIIFVYFKAIYKQSMAVEASEPEDLGFSTQCLCEKAGRMAHSCEFSSWETETGGVSGTCEPARLR